MNYFSLRLRYWIREINVIREKKRLLDVDLGELVTSEVGVDRTQINRLSDQEKQLKLIAGHEFLGFLSGERREFWLQLPLTRKYGKGWVSWDHISLARAWRITSYTLHWNNSQGTYCTYGTKFRPPLPPNSWSPIWMHTQMNWCITKKNNSSTNFTFKARILDKYKTSRCFEYSRWIWFSIEIAVVCLSLLISKCMPRFL